MRRHKVCLWSTKSQHSWPRDNSLETIRRLEEPNPHRPLKSAWHSLPDDTVQAGISQGTTIRDIDNYLFGWISDCSHFPDDGWILNTKYRWSQPPTHAFPMRQAHHPMHLSCTLYFVTCLVCTGLCRGLSSSEKLFPVTRPVTPYQVVAEFVLPSEGIITMSYYTGYWPR